MLQFPNHGLQEEWLVPVGDSRREEGGRMGEALAQPRPPEMGEASGGEGGSSEGPRPTTIEGMLHRPP